MHTPRVEQTSVLVGLLRDSPLVDVVLSRVALLDLPDWYLGAGCIAGTVWNNLHGFADGSCIKDCDVVYFDDTDTSYEAEDRRIHDTAALFADLPVPVELRNQARVHLWYERRFGSEILPYRSSEDAIRNWPTTATSIGVRTAPNGSLDVCAPHGLADLLDMVVRPNKSQVSREVYEAKAARWSACWPKLTVIPWEQ
jgi:hypothetical protein